MADQSNLTFESFVELKQKGRPTDVFVADIKMPVALGRYFVWNWIPTEQCLMRINQIRDIPEKVQKQWRDQFLEFISRCEKGVFSYGGFSDPFIPGLINPHVHDPDIECDDYQWNAEECLKKFGDDQSPEVEELRQQLHALIAVLSACEELIPKMKTSITDGPFYEAINGLLTHDHFYRA